MQVVDSTCGRDTKGLWIQNKKSSVKAVVSVYWFKIESYGLLRSAVVLYICYDRDVKLSIS